MYTDEAGRAGPPPSTPRAVVFGCTGPEVTDEERTFFGSVQPFGFILFTRNCEAPDQVRRLVADLRAIVGRPDAPVLIDQEGGRVARLKPPHWRAAPSAGDIGTLARRAPADALEAARINARLLAAELHGLGITVDCAPVLDVPVPGAHDIIGDRALDSDPRVVGLLGQAICEAFLAGGVLPVMKHIPGHGRARADSHLELPVVSASRSTLWDSDFVPFRMLRSMPWAMTAHLLYQAVDPQRPATLSPIVIEELIRGDIGFDGLLITDDVSMRALSGSVGLRAAASIEAGCDLVLHCNGNMTEMREIAAAVPKMTPKAKARFARGEVMREKAPEPFDVPAALRRLDALMKAA